MFDIHPPHQLSGNRQPLMELALNLRWSWSHISDELWRKLDAEVWELTQNPLLILNSISPARLEEVTAEHGFTEQLEKSLAALHEYLEEPGWYQQACQENGPKCIAYFSMEFGIGKALPLYAGGLGMLAGDHLKTASDLGVPLVGVGLLYYQGYVRQMLSAEDWQLEFFPHNDSANLPIIPVRESSGALLRVPVGLPGRTLLLRVWQVQVGKVPLYLLDSNDPLNSPADQGITSRLYHDTPEVRLLQEIALGIGGWRTLTALGIQPEVCHLNEGHAALVVLERARQFMHDHGVTFHQALWATRGGNVFTTHTPVSDAFDHFNHELIAQYLSLFVDELGISMDELLALGQKQHNDDPDAFNMPYLALHGSAHVNGVSKLHGEVSQRLFNTLFERWPRQEVPIGYITNGVHVPSWDSQWADELWTKHCGKQRWLGTMEKHQEVIAGLSDEEIWACRAKGRLTLVEYARKHLARQLGQHGAGPEARERAMHILDPNVLLLGFARRFTAYKRPNLLLLDPERLIRILTHPERPAQLIIAGKTHPQDTEGKRLLQAVARFAKREELQNRVVFLEDYDISLAQQLVQGIDVWINTPRRTWEACGTSGMKVLVNGGLNLSELDGWWAEAYSPDVGWAFDSDDRPTGTIADEAVDRRQANKIYDLLEQQVSTEFYDRNRAGIPTAWINRIRASMAKLTCHYSSNRMVRDYVEQCYLPAAAAVCKRSANDCRLAVEMELWHKTIANSWNELHFGNIEIHQKGDAVHYQVQVYLGDIPPDWITVELYAEPTNGGASRVVAKQSSQIAGAVNGFIYTASLPLSPQAEHHVPRIIPHHPDVAIPLEESHICWQR